jgi:glyoxylase-like metal-dependent hydrolase (beta-lactamase superfamily II)
MHPDHVFGAEPLREAGAAILGHANLPRALADRAEYYRANFAGPIGDAAFLGSRAPVLDRVIAAQEAIELGGRVLELRAWPSAHTGADLTVFDRTSGILVAGDLVFDTHTPALDGSLRGWLAVLSRMKGLPARRVVPGHGGRCSTGRRRPNRSSVIFACWRQIRKGHLMMGWRLDRRPRQ